MKAFPVLPLLMLVVTIDASRSRCDSRSAIRGKLGRVLINQSPWRPLLSSYAPMSTPALSKFDRIPVRVVNPHRPLPRFFVRTLEKLHPMSFQLFVKCIEVIRR